MKDAWLTIRSVFFWTLSVVHFFPLGILALVLSVFLDPRKHDGLLRYEDLASFQAEGELPPDFRGIPAFGQLPVTVPEALDRR